MNIPHEVEELILEFVGLKRKKRCIAQTKSNRICLRRTDNWILCTQHMKRLNTGYIKTKASPQHL